MSFLFPAFLLGSLALAIPVALHLWKRNVAPRIAFSDIRFLKRAPVMQTRRRRLRELLLLALRLTALALLVVAFARPFLDTSGMLDRAATVVALDRSFSLGAPAVFAQVRAAASAALVEAPSDHVVGLVVFDHQAVVAHELSPDRSAVVAAAERVEPGLGATSFPTAIQRAVELVGPRPGRIVVVTDRQQIGWDGTGDVAVPAPIGVEVRSVEPGLTNIAVSSLQASANRVTAVVSNAAGPRATVATLEVDGRPVETREVQLRRGPTEVVFEWQRPATGVLALTVDDPDGLPADNQRFALLDPPPPAVVGIVTNGGRLDEAAFYLERALLAGDEDGAFAVESIAPSDLGVRPLSELQALVLIGTEGLDRSGRERVAALVADGGGVLIVGGPSLDVELIADVLGDPFPLRFEPAAVADTSLSVTDTRHPIFQVFGGLVGTLGQVRIRQSVRIVETEPLRVIARFEDGRAALAEYSVGRGRAVVFASDLNNEWNDFPRRPTFVPFVHELLAYVIGAREFQTELRVGEVSALPAAASGPVTLPESGRRVVVNVDPRESDLTPLSSEGFLARVVQGEAAANVGFSASESESADQEAEQSYWWYALWAMVVVLIAEAWLGRNTA